MFDIFKENVFFNEIVNVYEFDKQLRILIVFVFKCIEVELKVVLSDMMLLSKKCSDWYIDGEYFNSGKRVEVWKQIVFCEDGLVKIRKEKQNVSLYVELFSDIQMDFECDIDEI